MPFPVPLSAPEHLSESSPARDYIIAYLASAGLSQNQLAQRIRQSQQRTNYIISGRMKTVDVQTIISICLVLGLNEKQSIDLLSRFERALSPANPVHKTYRKLIRIYSDKLNYKELFGKLSDEEILTVADNYLISRNQPPFPNIYE